MKYASAAVLAIATAVALVASAGAGTQRSSRVDLSTRSAVMEFLASKGVDSAGVVIQRGDRLYAGPNCPGRGWNCTTATRVVQVSAKDGGENRFECTESTPEDDFPPGVPEEFPPEFFPDPDETEGPDTCVIVQANVDEDNVARCVEVSDEPVAAQQCWIAQFNVEGDNRAFVEQVHRTGEAEPEAGVLTQSSDQDTHVFQQNARGRNDLHSKQKVDLDLTQTGGVVAQNQSADVDLDVVQNSGTGKQSTHAHQFVREAETARGGVLGGAQSQFSDLRGFVTQNSVDVSQAVVKQHEDLDQKAPKNSAVVQDQFGPVTCCTTQVSNEHNKFNIDQFSSLRASQPTASQTTVEVASCVTSGNCTAKQLASTNTDREQNFCSGSACFISIVCFSVGDDEGTSDYVIAQKPGECVPDDEGGGLE